MMSNDMHNTITWTNVPENSQIWYYLKKKNLGWQPTPPLTMLYSFDALLNDQQFIHLGLASLVSVTQLLQVLQHVFISKELF